MTEQNKQNCLTLRYAFRDETGDFRGEHQDIRHQKWVDYVNKSNLTPYEKELCIKEFLNDDKTSRERYNR